MSAADDHSSEGGRTVLVTGGAGFIGSHTCVELLDAGWNVVSLDNYANSSPVALRRVEEAHETTVGSRSRGRA